jgi:hypothetical protein
MHLKNKSFSLRPLQLYWSSMSINLSLFCCEHLAYLSLHSEQHIFPCSPFSKAKITMQRARWNFKRTRTLTPAVCLEQGIFPIHLHACAFPCSAFMKYAFHGARPAATAATPLSRESEWRTAHTRRAESEREKERICVNK